MSRRLSALIIAGGILAASSAVADIATLNSPARGGALSSGGAISFTLSQDISQDRLNRLFVEFDGADVTGMVAMNGLSVSFQPLHKLSPGDYVLKIYEQKSPGKFNVVQTWTVRVAADSAGGGEVYGNLEGQYNYLLRDNLEGTEKIDPHTGSAVASVTGKTGGQSWDFNSIVNGFYDSKQSNNPPDEEHLMLGEYLLQGRGFSENLTTTLRLGNHDTGVANLLTDQYYRRGASAQFDVADRLLLTAFSQDPARAIGVTNVAGFGDDDQRAEGAFAKFFPLESYGKRVFLESGYYYGRGTIGGAGEGVASDPNNEGRGWVVAAEGQTLDDKFNLRGEFAETEFDEDGKGLLVTPEHDNGIRARAMYAPLGSLSPYDVADKKWHLTALYEQYGTFFRSLTNLGIAQDQERLTLLSDFTEDTLGFTVEAYGVQNNVESELLLPTDRGIGILSQLSVAPSYLKNDIAPESFLGRSTFTLGGSVGDEQRHETPAGFAGDSLDQTTWTANAGWTVAYEKVTASLAHTYSDFDNRIIVIDSYQTHFTDLSMTCTPTDWLTVTPALQMQIEDRDPAESTRKYFAAIDTAAVIIPEKLTNTFHYSSLLDDGGAENDVHNVSTEFVWQVKQAQRNDPGYALALSGYYDNQNIDPDSTVNDEHYKVFLSLKVSAPFGF